LGHITLQENTTLYKIWDVAIGANAINAIKNDFNSRGNRVFTITTAYNNDPVATDQGSFIRGDNEWLPQQINNLCWEYCPNTLAITSTNSINVNEGTPSNHTLVANDTNATFNLIENTSGLFNLTGTTLTFNGATTDFESNTKSYTAKVKATTGDGEDKNVEQTITVNLIDLNDETPTAITLTGSRTIAENTATGTEIGTLSATDADVDDIFTYTNSNTAFTLDSNKVKAFVVGALVPSSAVMLMSILPTVSIMTLVFNFRLR
jgi:hypothetical protein